MKALLLAAATATALTLFTGGSPATAQQTPLQERIDRASSGDTVTVENGVYHEHVVIDKPLALIGMGGPVIDGGGTGDVVTITADDVTLSGFVIRGSGRAFSQEPAAVRIIGTHNVTVLGNQIEDSHFGVHVTESHHASISGNTIDIGKGVDQARQRHGVYLWQVEHSIVANNIIRHTADGIHLEFAHANAIAQNVVENNRYGLHLMYAHNNSIVDNAIRDNLAGAVLMFSHELVLKDNEITGNRKGATGTGILLKDVDNLFAEGNTVLRNKWGMTADGTPQSVGASAIFMKNLFALNDTGIGLMSNSPITFVENAMIENTVQVRAMGGDLAGRMLSGHGGTPATPDSGHNGHAGHDHGGTQQPAVSAPAVPEGAVWSVGGRGNYWSDYRGYDRTGDGVGDTPYRPRPAFAGGLAGNDMLRAFNFTLAQQAVDFAADMFPVYRYDPVIVDEGPLMRPPGPALPAEGGVNQGLLVVSGLLLLLAGTIVYAVLDLDAGRLIRPVAPRPASGGVSRG